MIQRFSRPRSLFLFLTMALLLQFGLSVARASDPDTPTDNTQESDGNCNCALSIAAGKEVRSTIKSEAEDERKHITSGFSDLETWIVGDFFNDTVYPALQNMASSLTAAGMEQVAVFGSFLDAQQQLEAQRAMQNLTADAHQHYQTSYDMCEIGTAAVSIGAAERNAEAVAQELSRRSQGRQLGSLDTSASDGPAADRLSRLTSYKNRNCDPADNNGGFAIINGNGICNNTPAEGQNRDIDYTHTIETSESVNMNFDGQSFGDQDIATQAPATVTSAPNDEDVIALDNNLFAHDLFTRESPEILGGGNAADSYLDARSVIAKRSVAENSFFAIAGMKSAGSEVSEKTAPFLQAVFQQLGVSADDAKTLVGVRPSYYSLLDAMARRIYQTPQFFSNLYDTPANVERKDVAMQAIGLMLDRDQYKSELRSEADLAVLLELELHPWAQNVQSRINWMSK